MARIWYYQSVGRGGRSHNPDNCYLCNNYKAGYLVGRMKDGKLIRYEKKRYFPLCLKCAMLLTAKGWIFETTDQVKQHGK